MSTDTAFTTDDTTKEPRRIGRRLFLISAALVGGGVAVGAGYVTLKHNKNKNFVLPSPDNGGASFGAWLTIDGQGLVTAYCPHQEMGQGIMSLAASLVAEELDANPAQMRMAQAPVTPAYANALMVLDGLPFKDDDHGMVATATRGAMRHVVEAIGINGTGGSTGTRNIVDGVQRAAASARSMLLEAACRKLNVPVGELTVAMGVIQHAASNRTLNFGDVATDAGKLAPREATLKPRSAYRMLGSTGMQRLDVPSKVDGSAQFGSDIRLPGQLYAAIKHAPVFGGSVQAVTFADKTPQIKATVQGTNFIAVVGTSWYAAKQYLDLAKVTWNDGPLAALSSADIFARYAQALADNKGDVFETRGERAKPVAGGKDVTADYRVPFLAHATMEPMNCTVFLRDQNGVPACDVWVGNQSPIVMKWMLADVAGVESDKLTIHTPMLGGGFGRRIELDVMNEAIEIAKAVRGTPVQTLWSREEDMQHDVYRPAAMARFSAQLGANGLPTRMLAHLAGPSVSTQFMKRTMNLGGGMPDRTSVDGVVSLPYALPNLEVKQTLVDTGIPVGFWRSVGHSQNAFFVECFIDECAAAAGQDPMAYRLALLRANTGNAHAQRCIKVLEAAAAKSGWGQPLAQVPGAKVGRGIALAESFRSIVAEVAEVVVGPGDAIRVRRVVAAVDCGFAIDPVNVVAQLRSGVHFGLTAALYGRIDIDKGRVKQSNFTDYRMVKLADAPRVDVVIVNSDAALGGIGEVGTPPIAPAVANAIRAATGRAVRELPLTA